MINNDTKTKLITLTMALFMGLGHVSQANSETLFYRNVSPGATSSPSYFGIGPSEIADDAPFTGSHQVSSFRIGYRSSIPLLSTFRFYGVDPDTGLPARLVAEITRGLPAADFATPTITLDTNEQFIFTAEPGLFGNDKSGGWFSVRFESTDGSKLPFDLSVQLADGPSATGMYNITTGKVISILDPSGIIPVSLFLEMSSTATIEQVIPKVSNLKLVPSSVSVGASSTATVTLSSQAPTGGVLVKFSTDKNGIYFSNSEVVVKEGNTSAVTTVFTTKKAGPKGKDTETTASIFAETSDSSASATLTITK